MVRLSHRDFDACLRAIQELYVLTSLSGLRDGLLPLVSRLIPANHSSLNDFNARAPRYVVDRHPVLPELNAIGPQLTATMPTHPFFDHIISGAPVPKKISDRVTVR